MSQSNQKKTSNNLRVISHPLVTHKLNRARDKETNNAEFRRLIHEISMLMCYECTNDLKTHTKNIRTPVAPMDAKFLVEDEVVLVSILRAGNGILDGMLSVMPEAKVGHIGLYRDPVTLTAIEYYFKMPELAGKTVIMVDPMLATGHTAVAAIRRLKELNPSQIRFVCLLASPEGIELVQESHSDVEIVVAAIDDGLNEKKYIVPGLGDAGDRIYGTS